MLATAAYYRLDRPAALAIIDKVLSAVASWRGRGKALGIAAADTHEMEALFIMSRSDLVSESF